ncbi:DUF2683 family protein [Flavobacterium ardleyense]|uniref:DUF2683 family protein n=1 Tax=Flavobacterium ardleyense TaxID=2038737 RepID=A0ABW5ZCQ2_9FLAO
MTTITIKINEKSKKGKAFLEFARAFFANEKDVIVAESKDEKVEVEETSYNPEFVKMVLEADKRGNYTTLDPTDIWGSLELK